jgi:autophagy-related protein 17
MTSSPSIEGILNSQETASTDLASRLESLAAHYDQMAGALRESEAGEAFSKEDLSSTLPSTIPRDYANPSSRYEPRHGRTPRDHGRARRKRQVDREEPVSHLAPQVISNTFHCNHSAQLLAAREGARLQVESQRGTLDDLDELGDIMAEMLQRQETVEVWSLCSMFLPKL